METNNGFISVSDYAKGESNVVGRYVLVLPKGF